MQLLLKVICIILTFGLFATFGISVTYSTSQQEKLPNKALLASALSEKCSFTPSKLRFFILRAASK